MERLCVCVLWVREKRVNRIHTEMAIFFVVVVKTGLRLDREYSTNQNQEQKISNHQENEKKEQKNQ